MDPRVQFHREIHNKGSSVLNRIKTHTLLVRNSRTWLQSLMIHINWSQGLCSSLSIFELEHITYTQLIFSAVFTNFDVTQIVPLASFVLCWCLSTLSIMSSIFPIKLFTRMEENASCRFSRPAVSWRCLYGCDPSRLVLDPAWTKRKILSLN